MRASISRVVASSLLVVLAGCVPSVARQREELIEIPASDVQRLAVVTHNGDVRVAAAPGDDSLVRIRALIRVSAADPVEAQRGLDAIAVTTLLSEEGTRALDVGWRWQHDRPPACQAHVTFEIIAPGCLAVRAETRNGQIALAELQGACEAVTYNGRVEVHDAGGGGLRAKSYNGQISVHTSAPSVELVTYNGSIEAALGAALLDGSLETHNGSITIRLPRASDLRLECRTVNGRVHSALPLVASQQSKRTTLAGRLGAGSGNLRAATHNGSITLEPLVDEPAASGSPTAMIPSAGRRSAATRTARG